MTATTDYDELRDADAIVVALPTPLSRQREPDLRILNAASAEIAKRLRPGHLVVLESTTYPGTTREQVLPVLEAGSGLTAGTTSTSRSRPSASTPDARTGRRRTSRRSSGGITEASTEAAAALYAAAVDDVHPVSSPEAAELTKLLENIFRSVNIALVNELAQLCDRMELDVWEVVEAAATKPFGFMSFQPGPGPRRALHPDRPFYLTWKAREYGFYTEFIELAGKVNESMPYFCRSLVSQALNHHLQRSLKGRRSSSSASRTSRTSRTRGSPRGEAHGSSRERRAPTSPTTTRTSRRSTRTAWRWSRFRSIPSAYDCVVVVTNHSGIDYDRLVEDAKLVVDLRNATGANGRRSDKVWKL